MIGLSRISISVPEVGMTNIDTQDARSENAPYRGARLLFFSRASELDESTDGRVP
jgi:hypothetical protein